jgi:putative acetyltransferase
MYSYKHIQNFAPEMPQIIDVFYDSFAASEGIDEGDLIQSIVENLLGNTANSDLFVFGAIHNTGIIGCAIFSRLTYLHDPRNVFILSPMAVHPNHQNNGIGQNLLLESIGFLKNKGSTLL